MHSLLVTLDVRNIRGLQMLCPYRIGLGILVHMRMLVLVRSWIGSKKVEEGEEEGEEGRRKGGGVVVLTYFYFCHLKLPICFLYFYLLPI